MGILDFLRPDPTRHWPPARKTRLSLDLSSASVNGTALGDHYTALMSLGQPDNPKPYIKKRFDYLLLGFTVECDQDLIDYFGFVMQDEFEEGFSSCRMEVILKDRRKTEWTARTSAHDIEAVLGPPQKTDTDEDETVFFYDIDKLRLEFELTLDGQLKRCNVFFQRSDD